MKKLLILVIIGILIGLVVVLIQKKLPEKPLSVFNKTGEKCTDTDKIEYMYYSKGGKENNKFGLYVYAENRDFIEIAQKLVNSNNGDWGYVLIPYNVKDRDHDKWGRVFTQVYEKHLIPIIQLHDVDLADYKKQTEESAKFLNSFIWPIKQRYISVYNEPNDAKFWYGKVNAAEYARVLNYTIDTYKKESDDFFLLNGGLNVSADSNSQTLDAFSFMYAMNAEIPGIFNKLDGWASHSYPQPNFSGNPYAIGRWSIRAYENELDYLKNVLGVEKNLPVFITETGWAHAEGKDYDASFLPVSAISEFFKIAYEEVWLKDDRVRAVMPFTIWYGSPFDHFSWINDDKVPYKHYEVVKSIKKVKGNPQKLEEGVLEPSTCQIPQEK